MKITGEIQVLQMSLTMGDDPRIVTLDLTLMVDDREVKISGSPGVLDVLALSQKVDSGETIEFIEI